MYIYIGYDKCNNIYSYTYFAVVKFLVKVDNLMNKESYVKFYDYFT